MEKTPRSTASFCVWITPALQRSHLVLASTFVCVLSKVLNAMLRRTNKCIQFYVDTGHSKLLKTQLLFSMNLFDLFLILTELKQKQKKHYDQGQLL